MPVGTVIWYAAVTPPVGWLICNGQSTSGYPALAAVVGSNVPDLRGEFIRGADLGRGVDSGRVFKSSQSDAIRNITGTMIIATGWHEISGSGVFSRAAGQTLQNFTNGTSWPASNVITFNAANVVPTANENRPRNVALLPCIKY